MCLWTEFLYLFFLKNPWLPLRYRTVKCSTVAKQTVQYEDSTVQFIIQFLKVMYTVLTEQYIMCYQGYFVRQI